MTMESPPVKRLLILLMIISALPLSVFAANYQDTSTIHKVATAYLKQHITGLPGESIAIHVGKLDRRLHLHSCSNDLSAFLPGNSRHSGITMVGVRCTGTNPWTIYLPVKISVTATIAVAARNLNRGHVISDDDISMIKRNRHNLHNGYYTSKDAITGTLVRRRIRAGAIFSRRNIKARPIVKRGEAVTIIAQSGSVRVEMRGVAKASGALNQKIRVLNKSSKRTVEGMVIGPGQVQITY